MPRLKRSNSSAGRKIKRSPNKNQINLTLVNITSFFFFLQKQQNCTCEIIIIMLLTISHLQRNLSKEATSKLRSSLQGMKYKFYLTIKVTLQLQFRERPSNDQGGVDFCRSRKNFLSHFRSRYISASLEAKFFFRAHALKHVYWSLSRNICFCRSGPGFCFLSET